MKSAAVKLKAPITGVDRGHKIRRDPPTGPSRERHPENRSVLHSRAAKTPPLQASFQATAKIKSPRMAVRMCSLSSAPAS